MQSARLYMWGGALGFGGPGAAAQLDPPQGRACPTVYSLANPSRQLRIYSTRTVGYVGTAVWVWGKSVRRQSMG